jgi:uncharacterized UPF0160 family protein
MFNKKLKLVTHNSSFHADDVFAAACLQIYFEDIKKQKTKIIRSRDEKIIESGDVVFDVGMKYDPETNRFDHHQKGGAGNRGEYNIEYSSFGLIWKHFGLEMVDNSEIHQRIDEKFVMQICAGDTAQVDFSLEDPDWNIWIFDDIFKLFYPENIDDNKSSDKAFGYCVSVARRILEKVIKKYTRRHFDKIELDEIYKKSENKQILVLDKFRFWSEFVKDKPELLYIIFPDSKGEVFRIRAVPDNEDEIKSRKALPEPWRGKWRKELREISKFEKAEFVHAAGFLGAANDLETAIKMAEQAVNWHNN